MGMRTLSFFGVMLSSVALAEPVIFVAPFLEGSDSTSIASVSVTDQVKEAIGLGYAIKTIESVEDFETYTATIYLEACPPKEYTGCLHVLAQRLGATYAVGGKVAVSGPEHRQIHWQLVGVAQSDVILTLKVDLDPDQEVIFYEGLTNTIDWAIAGGKEATDLRRAGLDSAGVDELAEVALNEQTALEMMGLLQSVETMVGQGRGVDQEHHWMTEEELLDSVDSDAALAPWDYLNMTQQQYLAFRNADTTESQWRHQQLGRAGTVTLRLTSGVSRASLGVLVDGRYVQDPNANLARVESRTEAARMNSVSPTFDLSVLYGATKVLDVGLELRHAVAWQQSAYFIETVGDALPVTTGGDDSSYVARRVGLTTNWTANPMSSRGLTIGVSAGWLLGREVTEGTDEPTGVIPLLMPASAYLLVSPSFETGLTERFGLSATFDVGFDFGQRQVTIREGQTMLTSSDTPLAGGPLIIGITIGGVYRTPSFKKVTLYEDSVPVGVE